MAPKNCLRSENRKALLGVYAALDRTGKLAGAFQHLGVKFDGPLEPYSQLQKAAADLDQQELPIHRIHVAGAAMKVLRDRNFSPPAGDDYDQLQPVVEQLVKKSHRGTAKVGEVYSQLSTAASADRFHERWARLNRQPGKKSSPLHPTLAAIKHSRINTSLVSVDGEVVTRVETNMVVNKSDFDLQQVAPALLPDRWRDYNDFFCSLTRVPDRDADVPGATRGDLSVGKRHWCGVYQEKVGGCPDGWFPDTFLVFTWDNYPAGGLVLRYKLAPRRAKDRTVLRIDEGYIQVNRLAGGYEVSTIKYLLFDDEFISGGGQTLAAMAPQIGWLDQSIHQFGLGAQPPDSSGPDSAGEEPRSQLGGKLQDVLRRAQVHLDQSATRADRQLGHVMSKVRAGKYTLNDFVGDWGDAVLCAVRDSSRSLQNQIDFAAASVELANELVPGRSSRS